MGIDSTTGIDFGDLKYTVSKAKDNNGQSGYKVDLENGMSLFILENNIQNGAKIQKKDSNKKNDIIFSGFHNISIWGSQEKDFIKVTNSENVSVITDNDDKEDYVSFDHFPKHNKVKGSGDSVQVRGNGQYQSVNGIYEEDYDCRMVDKDADGNWHYYYKTDSQHDKFGNKRPEMGL